MQCQEDVAANFIPFSQWETGALSGKVFCPRSHNQSVMGPGFKPRVCGSHAGSLPLLKHLVPIQQVATIVVINNNSQLLQQR